MSGARLEKNFAYRLDFFGETRSDSAERMDEPFPTSLRIRSLGER
jgi:hypothetical protein